MSVTAWALLLLAQPTSWHTSQPLMLTRSPCPLAIPPRALLACANSRLVCFVVCVPFRELTFSKYALNPQAADLHACGGDKRRGAWGGKLTPPESPEVVPAKPARGGCGAMTVTFGRGTTNTQWGAAHEVSLLCLTRPIVKSLCLLCTRVPLLATLPISTTTPLLHRPPSHHPSCVHRALLALPLHCARSPMRHPCCVCVDLFASCL